MSSAAFILDVGHGSSTLVTSSGSSAVIDAAPGSTLFDLLKDMKINEIDYVIISHLDSDHAGGLEAILQSDYISVKNVFFNVDYSKKTRSFSRIKKLIKDGRTGNASIQLGLTTTTNGGHFSVGDVELDILFPPPDLILTGIGNTDDNGNLLNTNNLSAVVRVNHDNSKVLLIPGDIESVSLQRMLDDKKDISADMLLFPHHGGQVGSPLKPFTNALLENVNPHTVFFSTGRGMYGTPRKEIVREIMTAKISVACTQISENCCSIIPKDRPVELKELPSRGRFNGQSCAGTILITLNGANSYVNNSHIHSSMIQKNLPGAMCFKARLLKGLES